MAKILFLGTPTFAVPTLQAVAAAGFEVVAAVSQPDRPQGRGRVVHPTPVAASAREIGLPLLQPESCRDAAFLREVASLAPDYILVVAYGQILPEALLSLPGKLPINVHASLLPRWRGASPIAWAIASGDAVTGVTTMVVRRALDSGEILLAAEEPIRPDDTAATLGGRLSLLGAELAVTTLREHEAGRIAPRAQDESLVTWAHLLRKEDGRIDWTEPAGVIDRKVRGFFPWPKTFTVRDGRRVTLLEGMPLADASGDPGRVIAADPREGITVACGDGAYRVARLQPESHAAISSAQYVRGYHVTSGERWGGGGVKERPTLFLGLLAGVVLLLALLTILWFLPLVLHFGTKPPLAYLPLAVPGLVPATLCLGGLLLLLAIVTGRNLLPGSGPRRWAVRFFYPATVYLGSALRIHRDRIAASFVEVNNRLVRSRPPAVSPERLLLLMPHCLQHTACGIRITAAVTNCKRCGKCDIARLVELSERIGGHLAVATGGTLARRIITEMRPGAIVAVACERDLIAGIQDTHPLPVLGILNRRPHGPCRDTGVDMEEVTEAVSFFLGRPSPD